jgi:hypothetical protein
MLAFSVLLLSSAYLVLWMLVGLIGDVSRWY